MRNILNQEVQKPVYMMSREEMIQAISEGDSRSTQITKNFYVTQKELISKYI